MSKTKRMIYIREENVEFYDSLENKSDFLNECLKTARLGGVTDIKVTEAGEHSSNEGNLVNSVEAMRLRDKERLADYRKKNGLYDPTRS